MVFQAQISNFIEFGPEMAQRNGAEVCSLELLIKISHVQEKYMHFFIKGQVQNFSTHVPYMSLDNQYSCPIRCPLFSAPNLI